MSQKKCFCCKRDLSQSCFHSAKNRRDGLYPYCKECCKKKLKERAQKNPQAEQRRKAHKGEYDRKRYEANREEIISRTKEYYRINPEKERDRIRAWQKKNVERVRAYKASNKAKRRSVKKIGIGGPELKRWTEMQEKICYWCGIECADSFHVDHYYPLSKGGNHELENLVISCPSCNLRKSDKNPIVFAREIGRV